MNVVSWGSYRYSHNHWMLCAGLSAPHWMGKGMPMTISPASIRFNEDALCVTLSDGRTLGVPLAWFPRLLHATPEARAAVTLSPFGLHWEALDEDISIAGLLAGRGDMSGVGKVA